MDETLVRSIASCVFTPANQPAPSTRTRATARAKTRLGRARCKASSGMLARSCAAVLMSLVISETSTPIHDSLSSHHGQTWSWSSRADAAGRRGPGHCVIHVQKMLLGRRLSAPAPLCLSRAKGRNAGAAATQVSPPLERVAGRLAGGLEIAHVEGEAGADAGADRHHHHLVRDRCRHPEAADEVGRAVDREEAFVEGPGRPHVVDEHHRAGALATEVEADRGALPEQRPLADVLGIERALAVAQAADERARCLLAENVAVGLAPALDRLLDGQSEPARHGAEEAVTGIDARPS